LPFYAFSLRFYDLSLYKIIFHRKWFRFKYLSHLLFDALYCFNTSGKKAIGGAPFWPMRGVYGMRHHCHTTSNNLSVAHLNVRHA
jgi:hypothetical protein